MIYFSCPDLNYPVGGIKQLYRHTDVLNKHGIPASILHTQPGFRCTWFRNATRISYENATRPGPGDFLVLPEIYGPYAAQRCRGVKKVIFNQSAYLTFCGYSLDPHEFAAPYTDSEVAATIVVSEDNRKYLQYVFPAQKIFRIHNGIDSSLFSYWPHKKAQIAFMPRKNLQDIVQVINILKFRNVLEHFNLYAISNKTEEETAQILKESLIFLSFGYPEGFSLPPAEAMACGCITIGFHGNGGKEFMRPEFCYPIPQGEIIEYAKTVEKVIREYAANPLPFAEMTKKAADFINSTYSLAREEKDIIDCWRTILGR